MVLFIVIHCGHKCGHKKYSDCSVTVYSEAELSIVMPKLKKLFTWIKVEYVYS